MDPVTVTGCGIFDTHNKYCSPKQTPNRTVDNFEVEYILDANGETVLNGRIFPLSPGMVILAKPEQSRFSVPHFRCRFIHLTVSPDSELYPIFRNAPSVINNSESAAIGKIIEDLSMHFLTNEKSFDFRVKGLIYELAFELKQATNAPEAPASASNAEAKKHNDAVVRVTQWMEKNFDQKITLETLSDLVGYSPHYFHAIFLSVMKMTPLTYLERLRLANAKVCLAMTDESVCRIAMNCGFATQSHFCQFFRKKEGVSPLAYRKSCHEFYENQKKESSQ